MTTQVKKQLYLTHNQNDFIKEYSKKTGIPMSEVYRRAIDMFIDSVSTQHVSGVIIRDDSGTCTL